MSNFKSHEFAKFAQSFFGGNNIVPPTLHDLYNAIRADAGLDSGSKAQLINQVKGLTGYADDSTLLSALMAKGLGGVLGWLISKYFGMGVVGQAITAAVGYGLGSMLNKHLNSPADPLAGTRWRTIQ